MSAAGKSDATVACSHPSPRCSTSCAYCASACPDCGACSSSIPPWPPSNAAVATAKPIVLWGPGSARCGLRARCRGRLHLRGSTVVTCTTTVPVHTVHRNMQHRVPSHGGSCPGTATVLCAWTPSRHTTVTTVGLERRTSPCGRGANPQRPRAAPSCPWDRFVLAGNPRTVVDWCGWEATVAPGLSCSGYASSSLWL